MELKLDLNEQLKKQQIQVKISKRQNNKAEQNLKILLIKIGEKKKRKRKKSGHRPLF